jgi:hypothetical protein
MRSSRDLKDTDVDVPVKLKPEDFDWEQSRPMSPWAIHREVYKRSGFWHLDCIELFRADILELLRSHRTPDAPEAAISPVVKSNFGQRTARPRGMRPLKLERVRDAMRDDIKHGRYTVAELENMLEKNLAAHYGVSRDTARKARKAVVSELNSRQMPTNDK